MLEAQPGSITCINLYQPGLHFIKAQPPALSFIVPSTKITDYSQTSSKTTMKAFSLCRRPNCYERNAVPYQQRSSSQPDALTFVFPWRPSGGGVPEIKSARNESPDLTRFSTLPLELQTRIVSVPFSHIASSLKDLFIYHSFRIVRTLLLTLRHITSQENQ